MRSRTSAGDHQHGHRGGPRLPRRGLHAQSQTARDGGKPPLQRQFRLCRLQGQRRTPVLPAGVQRTEVAGRRGCVRTGPRKPAERSALHLPGDRRQGDGQNPVQNELPGRRDRSLQYGDHLGPLHSCRPEPAAPDRPGTALPRRNQRQLAQQFAAVGHDAHRGAVLHPQRKTRSGTGSGVIRSATRPPRPTRTRNSTSSAVTKPAGSTWTANRVSTAEWSSTGRGSS